MIPPYYLYVCLCLPFDILNQQIYFHNNLNFTQFKAAKNALDINVLEVLHNNMV